MAAINPQVEGLMQKYGQTGYAQPETKKGEIGKDQFLQLLITQLKNQDPLSPMDNTEFTAQMATFSSLEQLFGINDNLKSLQSLQGAMNNTQAMTLIGKEVEAMGSSIQLSGGRASDMAFDLPAAASGLRVTIKNAEGAQVATIDRGVMKAGRHELPWNGTDNNGSTLVDGYYTYEVEAYDANGDPMQANTYARGIVNAVSMRNGITQLHVGGSRFSMNDITEIREPAAPAVN